MTKRLQNKMSPHQPSYEIDFPIYKVPIIDIKVDEGNPKSITDEKLQNLITSLETYRNINDSWAGVLVVNKRDMTLVDGHQRLKAAKVMQLETVPVLFVDLPEKGRKALNIAFEHIRGHVDYEKLKIREEELKIDPNDTFYITGIEDLDLDKILKTSSEEDKEEEKSGFKQKEKKQTICPECGHTW